MRFTSNQKILHYRIIDFIGAGGMGEVYRAVHESIDRIVALKVLNPVNRSDDFVAHFFNEAKIQARLQHANVATLYDFFEFDGLLCMAMEFIGGRGLDDIIVEFGGLSMEEALPIFKDIVSAIGYIHQNGILHRDLKPGNIRIDQQGMVKLLDFGIAQDSVRDNSSNPRRILGTLQYMAPEQLSGKGSDHRTDIWSLGVLFYEMLTGQLPFGKETVIEYLDEVNNRKSTKEIFRRAPLSEDVKALIYRCLERKPTQRYLSIRALEQDLERLQFDQPQYHEPDPAKASVYEETEIPPSTFRIFPDRKKIILGLAAFCIAIVVSAIVYMNQSNHVDRKNNIPFRISITGNYPVVEVYQGGEKIDDTPFEGTAPAGTRIQYTLKHPEYREETVDFVVDPIERRNDIYVQLKKLQDQR
jgi:serine/threonine-protein kinase